MELISTAGVLLKNSFIGTTILSQTTSQLFITNDVRGSAGYDTSVGYSWLRANRAFDTGYSDAPGLAWDGDFFREIVVTDTTSRPMLFPVIKTDTTHKDYAVDITAGWYGGLGGGPPTTTYPFTLNAYVVSLADVPGMFVDDGTVWHYSKIRDSAVPTWTTSITLSPTVLEATMNEIYRSADYPDPPHAIIISGILVGSAFSFYQWKAQMRITRPL
jgi:hypothetical protein